MNECLDPHKDRQQGEWNNGRKRENEEWIRTESEKARKSGRKERKDVQGKGSEKEMRKGRKEGKKV